MLLQDARREARVDDRWRSDHRWKNRTVAAGIGARLPKRLPLVEEALRGGPGPYALQAAIAAQHCRAASAEDTDWPQIVSLYELLERLQPSPVVSLNRAVAVAMAEGPQAGAGDRRRACRSTSRQLSSAACRPRRSVAPHGIVRGSRESYRRALALVTNDSERRFLRAAAARSAGGGLLTPAQKLRRARCKT